jgi:hypothetical protein
MASTAQAMASMRFASYAACMYEPKPGRRKSSSPNLYDSQIIRKNHPPAMLIMLFHTNPIVAYGSSTHFKRCHQLNRYAVAQSC